MKCALLSILAVVACKSSSPPEIKPAENKPPAAAQSFAEGMKVLCEAPAGKPEEMAGYLKSHITNPETIQLFAALADENPADRLAKVNAAIARAGLTSCPMLVTQDKKTFEHVPVVTAAGLADFDKTVPVIVVTPTTLVADGKAIIALANGQIPPEELEGGAHGMAITRLQKYMEAFAAVQKPKGELPAIGLFVDPSVGYRTLLSVLYSTKKAGFTKFELAVRVADDGKQIPLDLPAPQPVSVTSSAAGKPTMPVMPVVSITKDKLLLWSISGQEGTGQKPKLSAKSPAELGPALAEIVGRRWKDGKRGEDDLQIIVQADGTASTQIVAEVMAAVRATTDGKQLFPRILLSSGFE